MIEIRRLLELDQFAEAVQLQQDIWGFTDRELLPVRLFVVATKIGGHLFGAYDGDRMVAFLVAIPGLKEGEHGYLHSHMMGVLPDYRNHGLGRKLKLAQREDALTRGIPLVEWTFDPLELKNAYLNIEKLGAIVRRYLFNNYGQTSSPLHQGLPTDRLVAEWWVSHPRAVAATGGEAPTGFEAARSGSEGGASFSLRGASAPLPEGRVSAPTIEARIPIESNIADLRRTDPAKAREIQLRASEQFTEHFRKGLAVVGFERSTDYGTYLLAPWHSQ